MYGYIYLLQTRESIRLDETIYKVGRTTQETLGRFNQYPKGSLLWLHLRCNDEVETERRLLIKFTERFEKIELYGNEYFSGDINDMMVLICSEIGHSCNAPTSVVKGTREQNILLCRIRELEEKNQILTKVKEYLECENTRLRNEVDHQSEGERDVGCTIDVKEENDLELPTKKSFACTKCNRIFSKKSNWKRHEKKCDGLDKKQCKNCLKYFTTKQGKWQHMKYVQCVPHVRHFLNDSSYSI